MRGGWRPDGGIRWAEEKNARRAAGCREMADAGVVAEEQACAAEVSDQGLEWRGLKRGVDLRTQPCCGERVPPVELGFAKDERDRRGELRD